ncbi:MAG: Spx/MgsR family RNA polymerase-binding regulatory protein [Campylobacteraceae bacterium]|nr:Spx/MgsR family RNA polymerase-binding regulatory protein [Campylobacteraceae bacterium]
MIIYGISSCGSVKKAIAFCKKYNLDYDFIDMREEPVGGEKIDHWLSYVDIDTLFNKRGTKYRTLGLKELDLDDEDKHRWLIEENLLIKRPVIEHNHGVSVGYDEKRYLDLFCDK